MSIKTASREELQRIAKELVAPDIVELHQELAVARSEIRGLQQAISELKRGRESDHQSRQALKHRVDKQIENILKLAAKFEDDHK